MLRIDRQGAKRGSDPIAEQLRANVTSLLSLLDRVPMGVALVDRSGRLRVANEAVRRLLEQREGIELAADGAIRTFDNDVNRALREALTVLGGLPRSPLGGAWLADRPSGGEPVRLVLSPLEPLPAAPASAAVAALFVLAPGSSHPEPEEMLSRVYRLTPAEATLAAVMMQGCCLEHAAEAIGISVNTAKTHLERVFGKTGVSRQAELVYLFMTGPALFSHWSRPPRP